MSNTSQNLLVMMVVYDIYVVNCIHYWGEGARRDRMESKICFDVIICFILQWTNRKKKQYKRWRQWWRLWKRLERRLFQLFSDNLAVVLDLLILQDKHNIRTLSENVKLICTRYETGQNSSSKTRFSTRF